MKTKSPTEILPGLYQILIPIPIESLHVVFVYLAMDGEHNLLIDSGWSSEEARNTLKEALNSLGLSFEKLENVVVSHLHPDHFGLAEEIRDAAPSSRLIMHKADAEGILKTKNEFELFLRELHEFLGAHGTPISELDEMQGASLKMVSFFRPPNPNFVAKGGEIIKVGNKWRFQIIHTPGHTIGNVCLYDLEGSKTLFSGDHVLPTITPNISLSPRYDSDPLGDYLDSLASLKKFDVGPVLPSHEHVFTNLGKRVDEIVEHHRERLEEVYSIFEMSKNDKLVAYDVAKLIHWKNGTWESIGPWERRAALMETLAHIQYLKYRGRLTELREVRGGELGISFSIPRAQKK